jgi:hypothetical protein
MVSIVESWRIIAYRQARTHNEEMCYKDGNEVLHVILSSAHRLCCFIRMFLSLHLHRFAALRSFGLFSTKLDTKNRYSNKGKASDEA